MDEDQKLDQNDHRRLGQELDLFVFSDLVGPGLPLWTPRGTVLRRQLDDFVQEMRDQIGFQAVTIPHITKKELYQASGHWSKFSEELFRIKSREGHEFAMKPMNCPHHTQIYASRPRSYRELPIRYRETTMNYRDEQTGELNGLARTRAFTQDDAHVFCREEQISVEVASLWKVIQKFYGAFDFPLSLRFSTRDKSDAYAGTDQQWAFAEKQLRDFVEGDQHDMTIEEEGVGDAAFYGPKLDFMAKDSLGRQWQVATIQLDFAQPEGLDLNYVNEKGENQRPVMIHCAVMGSIERFLAVLIEHTNGHFPLWLAPEQLRVATLNDDKAVVKLAKEVVAKAKEQGIRAELDDSGESVRKKVRDAEVMKVPVMVVIGPEELKSGNITPRLNKNSPDLDKLKETAWADYKDLIDSLAEHAKSRK
ncbi:MAG TPA: threonine--tRNA ligase [Candidatus Saccharimonadales bacterium]|nr:threonine--tRNA ligase [Candidatus Saccharimonadales bacterium]